MVPSQKNADLVPKIAKHELKLCVVLDSNIVNKIKKIVKSAPNKSCDNSLEN